MKSIYRDIAERSGGDIYLGVVGPVRTGKSTFVAQFMQKIVLPNIVDKNDKKRAVDELPQSADGKTIMTTQPKFVPSNGVKITLSDKFTANVRLIDCVGYAVDGAEGLTEDDKPRLVNTPWSEEPMPFEQAAEIGTRTVATEHSTVAVVVTTDGTIGDIPRANYLEAEDMSIRELQNVGRPFVVVVNSKSPNSPEATALCEGLRHKYGVTAIAMDVQKADKKSLEEVLSSLLREFPVNRICIDLPKWMRALENDNEVVAQILEKVKLGCGKLSKMRDAELLCDDLMQTGLAKSVAVSSSDMATGAIKYEFVPKENLFFDVVGKEAGIDIADEYALMSFVTSAGYAKRMYERVSGAFKEADNNGYGIVYPELDRMTVDEPSLIKQGNIYGVLMRATAPSYHIVRVDVKAEVSPMVGTEQQSNNLMERYKQNPQSIWNADMYGRSMASVTEESLMSKCTAMPVEIKQKLTKTIGKIVNENKGGLICFLL